MSTITEPQARDLAVLARNLAQQLLGRYWYPDLATLHEEEDRLAEDVVQTVRTFLEAHTAPTFEEREERRAR